MRRFVFVLFFLAVSANAAIAPIAYHQRTLANGLQVYSIEDHATPTVAIEVWYQVGSKDDPAHRSGFAHLFEHLMFKSTAHMKAEMMDRLTEDVGGEDNASTDDDITLYWEEVPSNYLRTLLWAEGDRMASLNVDEPNFKSEREVVKEEFRTGVLGPPYGLFYFAIDKDSYAKHPYKRPTIGSIEDLDAATLADVQAFHRTFYRPDNAVLVVAGDFDPKQLDEWVDKYLGSVPKPSTPIPRVTVKEPPRAKEKRFDEHGPNVPLPAIAITWLIPPASSADAEPLRLLGAILGHGESSRLYQSLVYRQQIAQDVSADADLRQDTGLFAVTATLASGKTTAAVEKALRSEVHKLVGAKVTAAELEKAKNLVITAALRRAETDLGKASTIRDAVVYHHDASYANKGLDRLQSVTAADVQRVAKKVFGGNAVVITYTAGAPASPPAGRAASRRGRAGTPAIQPAGRRRSEFSGGAK
jgi:zinc protease